MSGATAVGIVAERHMMRRSLTRDLVVYGLGEVAVRAFGLITLPLYTHVFTPSEFGVVGVVLTVSSLVMAIFALGSDVAYARYFFAAKSHEERQLITSTWVGFLAGFATCGAVVLIPAATPLSVLATGSPDHATLVAVAVLLAPLRLSNLMLAQVLRNSFRPVAYTALNIVGLAVSVGFIVAAVVFLELGLIGVFAGMLAAEVVLLPIRAWAAREMLVPRFSVSILREVLAYGIPIVPASLAYWVFSASDRLLLSNLSTLNEVGLYNVAFSLVSVTTIAVTALGQAWGPHAIRAFENDRAAASRFFGEMMVYVLAAFGVLAVVLTTFAVEAVSALTGDEYIGAAAAVGPLALGIVAYATTQVTAGGITLMRKTTYLASFSWMAATVNVVMNVLLIPRFGMFGAAVATAIAYFVLTMAYLVTSQRLWRISYRTRPSLTAAALTVAYVAGTYLLHDLFAGALGAVVKGAYVASFCACLLAFRIVHFQRLRRTIGDAVRRS